MINIKFSPNIVKAQSIDELVQKGVALVEENGEYIKVRAGTGKQVYSVHYLLEDSTQRLHLLRAPLSIRYLCRELIAYFRGSLKASDGLSMASKFWDTLADEHGMINSNYGYYVFYQLTQDGKSQYEWVIERLLENLQSRRAVININSVQHKGLTKDFPCTLAIQFFVRSGYLCCEVSSRSTDVITGLPYDMGFFSLLTELVYSDLRDRYYDDLRLGYTSMKPTFSQIYSNRNDLAKQILDKNLESLSEQKMPEICNAREFLADIYNQRYETNLMDWIRKKSGIVFSK